MAASSISFSRLQLKPPPPPPSRSHHLPIRIPSPPPAISLPRRCFPLLISYAIQDNGGGSSETLNEEPQQVEGKEEETKEEEEGLRVAEELKAMMAARKKTEEENKGGDFIGGVLEEVREIEWPPFGKVLGTTGVVLAIIAGSSLALLTVNAILAELSDRVFAGQGVQDFFG